MDALFSLKDELFNEKKVEYLAEHIVQAYPLFDKKKFVSSTIKKFPELELKQRIEWIREQLNEYLPNGYRKAVRILLKSLPEECDPQLTDNDFGDFIFAPINDYVAYYGCSEEYIDFSLNALEEITKRFSAEDSIRYFLHAFPNETLAKIEEWATHSHYHVRRLASEGTRPRLPWSQRVSLDNTVVISRILDNLYYDKTRFVVRSVANHLNDIAKDDPELVVSTLKRWKKSGEQDEKEMQYVMQHSMRTLVKQGNTAALELLGYQANPKIEVSDFSIDTPTVAIGSAAEFSFSITAKKEENLMIDYRLYFQDKKGNLRPKVFKIKKAKIKAGETIIVQKKHPLKVMTTKKLYPGLHQIELQINGKSFGKKDFDLK